MSTKAPKTITEFAQRSHLPAQLIRAVVKQIGGWQSFKESAADITNHGINGGFSGFIYYTETVKFAKKHKTVILETLADLARDLGEGDEFQVIAGFNCLSTCGKPDYTPSHIAKLTHGREPKNDDERDDYTQIMNALAWYAGEEVARSYTSLSEED